MSALVELIVQNIHCSTIICRNDVLDNDVLCPQDGGKKVEFGIQTCKQALRR